MAKRDMSFCVGINKTEGAWTSLLHACPPLIKLPTVFNLFIVGRIDRWLLWSRISAKTCHQIPAYTHLFFTTLLAPLTTLRLLIFLVHPNIFIQLLNCDIDNMGTLGLQSSCNHNCVIFFWTDQHLRFGKNVTNNAANLGVSLPAWASEWMWSQLEVGLKRWNRAHHHWGVHCLTLLHILRQVSSFQLHW